VALRILHFADAHIDMANYGRHDAVSGLPLRVMDFLRSLDVIVETAIQEQVDLVIFAGDAYKDRSPQPTFQREWGQRIMRLAQAKIPTLLLVGNHDLSPALGRANAIEEFKTLQVPHVRVLDRPAFLSAEDLQLPLQVIALPWIARSGMMASLGLSSSNPAEVYAALEAKLHDLVETYFEKVDPALPVVLTAHASVQGAKYGGERMVMLGGDLVLSGSFVRDPRLDYVALGHIHKAQNLNEGAHPPVVYPGSIERVDFGEAADDKFFVIAHVSRGHTEVEWRRLEQVRPFIDRFVRLDLEDGSVDGSVRQRLLDSLPDQDALQEAVLRLVVEYPRELEPQLDENALREYAAGAFEFHLVKRPQMDARVRLPQDQALGSLTPLELLELYWRTVHIEPPESDALQSLAKDLLEKPE
jgi:exonuclease SbcD